MPFQPPMLVTDKVIGAEHYKDLCLFIKDKTAHLDRRLMTFRTEKLPEYVRLYKARPKNETVDWPWPGAANLVIPIIGTYSDELLARIMGGIWMYDPLWAATVSGDLPTKDGDELKQLMQNFLMDMAYSPDELDLYRVEQSAFHSAIKYGTGVVITPYEYQTQMEHIYKSGGEAEGSPVISEPREFVKIDGPKPEILPLNRFIFEPGTPKLEDMKMFGHIESLDYWAVKDLPSKNAYYKQKDIEDLLMTPDAAQETEMEREINQQHGITSDGISTGAARWYIYNLWFNFRLGGVEYAFQVRYHKKSEKILWIAFNNYPKNMKPYQDMKLAYDDESYLGTGFAEMLHIAQKEISNNNNWRTNNRNYAMLGAWRIDPESKLSSMLDIFPGVGIPAKQNEVEYFKTGQDVGYSDGPDQFHMAVAKERVGVDPAMGGTGGGITNPKRGIYSAAGTSMVMNQANNRNNLRTGDMRAAHVKLGMKFLTMYSHFGIGEKIKKYGTQKEKLTKALEMYKDGSLGLRLRPASASNNKELERQNDILLSDRIDRFYAQEAQMVQAIAQPTISPSLKKLYCEQLLGARALMMTLLRNFNKDNTETVLPDIGEIISMHNDGAGAVNGNQNSAGPNPISQVPSGAVGAGGVPAGEGVAQ
ncbi:MAG: hypothetical protein P4L77_11950 [Sulfuriferula sp.]|nr:hypothetical protein [Sulfuriferula sp.]